MPCTEISECWRRLEGPRTDPMAWPGTAEFALLHGRGEWAIFGEDPLLVAENLELPELRIHRAGPVPPLLPDFLGFASYEAGYALDPCLPAPHGFPWPFPRFHFALHRKVRLLHRPSGTVWEAVREGLPPLGLRRSPATGPFQARKRWDSDDRAAFGRKVGRIRDAIRQGEVYQVNLCRQEAWAFTGDPLDLARRLAEENPAPFSALLAGEGWAVLSTSPERFLRIAHGRVESHPIKGTARRGTEPKEDAALAQALRASPKDRAELAMIVDLVRNDLTRVCEAPSVGVDGFPLLETHPNVHHLVAAVSGKLRREVGLPELFAALFPAGSITGCPKLAAMALIRGLEEHPRLAYTGALGWFRHDLGQMDLAVAIRTLSLGPGELRLGVGGGITWDSDPESEYLETVHKGSSLVRCLNS